MKEEWALLDVVLEWRMKKLFTAAAVLSAVANRRYASTMSWQIVAPAQSCVPPQCLINLQFRYRARMEFLSVVYCVLLL